MSKHAKKNVGSDFEDFLAEDGRLEESTAIAMKRVISWQIQEGACGSITADPENLKLSDAQCKELDQRLDAFTQDGDSGEKAATILKRIRKRL